MVFLYQYEWHNIGYPLSGILDRILLSRETTNFVDVGYYFIAEDT